MLSILIPTYNYNIVPLITKLYNQVSALAIDFEILCYDDCSTNHNLINVNESINSIKNTTYTVLKKNIGRSAIRNLLAKNAKYNWLLFLDADVMPKENNFIASYLSSICKESQVIYGGILYQEERPETSELLRWIYGNKREALSYNQRNKNTYLSFLTLNFLIKKDVFNTISFNEDIPNLRHEDTLFSYCLKLNNIHLKHINNPTYHLGLEHSSVFLKKSLEAVDALHLFLKQNLLPKDYTLITSVFYALKKIKLHYIFAWFYTNFKDTFEKNLLSNKPSLRLFDLYRLSYLCYLNTH